MTKKIFLFYIFLLLFQSHLIGNTRKFSNPISPYAPEDYADPSIVFYDGYYYAVNSENNTTQIAIYKSKYLESLYFSPKKIVWQVSPGTLQNEAIWAPRLQFVQGNWYIYFAAKSSNDPMSHRLFAIKSESDSPLGPYINYGMINTKQENTACIDGRVIIKPTDNSLYFVWSASSQLYHSNIFIAKMSDPLTIESRPINITQSVAGWESTVRESPDFIYKNGKSFITYSTGWLLNPDETGYKTGLLTNNDGDYLNQASWIKSSNSVFKYYNSTDGVVYAPGACRFLKSPDGSEDWIIYHAKHFNDYNYNREIRAQKLNWDNNNNPLFGNPVPSGIFMEIPSGQLEPETVYIQDFEGAQKSNNFIDEFEIANYGGVSSWGYVGLDTLNPISGTKSAFLKIRNAGTEWWNLQFKLDSKFTVEKSQQYYVKFKIKSNVATKIYFKVQATANFSKEINLNGNYEVQTFSFLTDPMDISGENPNFLFAFGYPAIPSDIWLDEIKIEKYSNLTSSVPADEKIAKNVLVNKDKIIIDSKTKAEVAFYNFSGQQIQNTRINPGINEVSLQSHNKQVIMKIFYNGSSELYKLLLY